MRITSTMFPTSLKQQSNDLLERELNVQNQIATGMSIINPSDDAATFAQVSLLRGQNSNTNSYLSVTNTLTLAANNTYQGMSNLQTILSSVSEIMTQVNNGSSQAEMQIYGEQLKNYAQQILQVVNQKKDGTYTYGGLNNQPPLVSASTGANYTAPTAADTLTINGLNVTVNSGDSYATFKAEVEKAVPGVTVGLDSSNNVVMTSATGPLTISDTTGWLTGSGAGQLALASNSSMALNNTTNGYTSQVSSSTINTNLTVSLGFTAGSDTSGGSNFSGFLTTGTSGTTDLYNMVVNAANDLLNATGATTDPFSGDTTLGGSYQAAVNAFDSAVSNVSTYVGRASAQLALLSSNQTELSADIQNQKQALNTLTSVNTANAATDLSNIQTAYQAALQSGAKILNLSLMNYLS